MANLPTRMLGRDGPAVTAVGLGLMRLSIANGGKASDEERLEFLDYVYGKGQRMWDSADAYGDSEDLVGRWFKSSGKRDEIFLATKFGRVVSEDGSMYFDNSPAYIAKACNKSLERLGTDVIDLYYCHRLNGEIPIEDVVDSMVELKKAGKIRHLGLSECSAATLRRACAVHHIDAVQMEYSPFAMEVEQLGLLDACRELGVAVVAYSPLGRGFVNGQLRSYDDIPEGDHRKIFPKFSLENFGENLKLVDAIHELAKAKGVTSVQLTLAWLLAQGDDIIPIPGTTSEKNYDENMDALDVKLTKEEVNEIRKHVNEAEGAGDRYPSSLMKYCFVDTPERK